MSDQENYLPPPPIGPPPAANAPGPNRRPLFIGGGAVVAAVVVAVALVFVLGGNSSSSAATPQAAVKKFLDAGKANDVDLAKKVLCKQDRTSTLLDDVASGGRIQRYSIGEEKTINGQRVVSATYTDSDGTQTVPFPVVKEGDNWRVCLSKIAATVGVPSTFPTPPGPDSSTPAGTGSAPGLTTPPASSSVPTSVALCAAAANGYQAASSYVGAALAGLGSVAQSCVYEHSVPESVTTYFKGKFFVPSTTDETATDIKFASTDGTSVVTVQTAKEPDGHWYVVGVKTG